MARLTPEALSSCLDTRLVLSGPQENNHERIAAYRAAALQCLRNAEIASDPELMQYWASRAIEWTDEAEALEKAHDRPVLLLTEPRGDSATGKHRRIRAR